MQLLGRYSRTLTIAGRVVQHLRFVSLFSHPLLKRLTHIERIVVPESSTLDPNALTSLPPVQDASTASFSDALQDEPRTSTGQVSLPTAEQRIEALYGPTASIMALNSVYSDLDASLRSMYIRQDDPPHTKGECTIALDEIHSREILGTTGLWDRDFNDEGVSVLSGNQGFDAFPPSATDDQFEAPSNMDVGNASNNRPMSSLERTSSRENDQSPRKRKRPNGGAGNEQPRKSRTKVVKCLGTPFSCVDTYLSEQARSCESREIPGPCETFFTKENWEKISTMDPKVWSVTSKPVAGIASSYSIVMLQHVAKGCRDHVSSRSLLRPRLA